jgi:Family of unknown function (DUF5691)
MVMNAWETLVASALVGTNRQEPSIDLTHPALTDYEAALPNQSPIQQILSAAGLITAYQAVGNSPIPANSPLLPPAAEADLPCCLPLTARHLSAILNESRYEPILPELLQLLAQAGQTVPPDYLPLLLDRGKRNKSLRSLITPILGTRGQWLVSQNPDWKYALGGALTKPIGTIIDSDDPAQLQEIWNTGTFEERLTALTRWRKIQPAEARQAIVASWKQDKSDDRYSFLKILEPDLSLDDEKLLEKSLFDRNERLRLIAASLLSQLPSNYRQRMATLASQCVKIVEKGNSCKIEIQLPKADDKDWQAAGLNGKSILVTNAHNLQMNLEECLLYQAVSGADLDVWKGDINRLITAMLKSNKTLLLLNGWVKAACYQRRTDWIEALLTRAADILEVTPMQQLLKALPIAAENFRSQFFTQLLTAKNFCDNIHQTLHIMVGDDDTANPIDRHRQSNGDLSSLVVRQYHQYIQQLDPARTYYSQQQNHSNLLGRYLDIRVLPDLHRMQSELSIEQFSYNPCIELLEFRRDMRSAFNTT